MRISFLGFAALSLALPVLPVFCAAEPTPAPAAVDNGTDPTKLSRTALASWEHLDLGSDLAVDTFFFTYIEPLGADRRTNVRLKAPVVDSDLSAKDGAALGDVGVKFTRIVSVTKTHGWVAAGEFVFDTAARAELGTGQNVFKPSVIYVKFLGDGTILAPSFQQSITLWGDDSRRRVDETLFDFYIVPNLPNKNYYMTIDPALSRSWDADTHYGVLAVTVGRSVGRMLGGNAFVQIKPSVFVGADRPADWGAEVAFKLVGF